MLLPCASAWALLNRDTLRHPDPLQWKARARITVFYPLLIKFLKKSGSVSWNCSFFMNLSWVLLIFKFVFLYRQLLCFLLLRVRVSTLDITTLFVGFWGSLLGSLHFLFPTKGLFSIQQAGSIKTFSFIPSLVLCRNRPMLLLLWELSAAYQRRPSLYITHLELVPPLRNGMKGRHVWAYLFKKAHKKIGDHNLGSINALGPYDLWGQPQVNVTCPTSPELSCLHCILLTQVSSLGLECHGWVGPASPGRRNTPINERKRDANRQKHTNAAAGKAAQGISKDFSV